MRMSFIASKPSAVSSAPAAVPDVKAPAEPVASRSEASTQAAAQRPESPVQPEKSPATPAADQQPRERRSRAARGGMSLKAVMDEPQTVEPSAENTSAMPSDETVNARWPELAKIYVDKPRLASMLSTTTLDMKEADGFKTVTFFVVNDAQKDWVESKLLHELEGNFRKVVGSAKVYLRVAVSPDDTPQEKKIYMPSDQAAELMRENEQVKNLVKDLELDIK